MNKSVLVVVGQTPPPHNGQANMIRQMLDGLADDIHLIHIRMAYSDSVVLAGRFGWAKIAHLVSLIRQTRRALKTHRDATLYYPPASPNTLPVVRDIIFLTAVRRLAGRTVFHFHSGGVSTWLKRHPVLRWLSRTAYRRPELAIELGHSCPRDGVVFEANRTVIVPNGVDVPIRKPTPSASASDTLRILYIGIHNATKGLFDLLEAARELQSRGVHFELRTAGLWYRQDERKLFEQKRQAYGLTEQVVCEGEKTGDALWDMYAWADVFFFPTRYPWETCGIVQLEAMAFALPVVASDWPGPRDIVVHGDTGFLCRVGDIRAYADVLGDLARNRDTIERLGLQGRKRYEAYYTRDHFVRRLKTALAVCLDDL